MKLILIILITALSTSATFAMPGGQGDDPIATIRQHYAQINRDAAKYKKVKKELSGFSAEGGTMVASFYGSGIYKIVATYYGETGRAYEEYYFWEGKLIFVLRKDSTYSKPLSGKVVRTTEDRFYFKDNQLIRWIDASGKQVAAGTTEYTEKQKDYLETSKLLTDGASSAKPTIESDR